MLQLRNEWQPLLGKEIEIRRKGRAVRRGIVDAVTRDDSILWLSQNEAEPRQLFDRTDGFEAWIEYEGNRATHDEHERPAGLALPPNAR